MKLILVVLAVACAFVHSENEDDIRKNILRFIADSDEIRIYREHMRDAPSGTGYIVNTLQGKTHLAKAIDGAQMKSLGIADPSSGQGFLSTSSLRLKCYKQAKITFDLECVGLKFGHVRVPSEGYFVVSYPDAPESTSSVKKIFLEYRLFSAIEIGITDKSISTYQGDIHTLFETR